MAGGRRVPGYAGRRPDTAKKGDLFPGMLIDPKTYKPAIKAAKAAKK